jgi:ketopantoate reductase
LQQLCTPATRVAVLQNGIDHVARVKPLADGAAVVPVIVYYNGERLAPDRVRLRHVGNYDLVVADDENGRSFAQLLEGTPLRVLLPIDAAGLPAINIVAAISPLLSFSKASAWLRAGDGCHHHPDDIVARRRSTQLLINAAGPLTLLINRQSEGIARRV